MNLPPFPLQTIDVMICYKGDWSKVCLDPGLTVTAARAVIHADMRDTTLGNDLGNLRFTYQYNGVTVKVSPAQEDKTLLSQCLPLQEKADTMNYAPQLVLQYDQSGNSVHVAESILTPEDQSTSK